MRKNFIARILRRFARGNCRFEMCAWVSMRDFLVSLPLTASSPMQRSSTSPHESKPHRIELNLRDVNQLFNTMDPSPFHEKDLDEDAEQFILNWIQEFPLKEKAVLIVHMSDLKDHDAVQNLIEQAIHHYFEYRARVNQIEFRKLMKQGRQSLLIGLTFLCLCLLLAEMLAQPGAGTFSGIVREGLTIAGWVAMWRPMEIYLYDWWPVRDLGYVYRKLSSNAVKK